MDVKKRKILKNHNINIRAYAKLPGSAFVFFTSQNQVQKNKEKLLKQAEERQQIGQAEQVVAKQKSKKSKTTTLIMLLVNLAVLALVLFLQIRKEGVLSFGDLLSSKLNYGYFVLLILAYILFMGLKSLRFYSFIKSSNSQRSKRPFLSYKIAALGKYYDAVTPMATGEQPFQIFYLSKRGMDTSTAISVPIAKYIVTQFAWMTMSLIAVIYTLVNKTLASSGVVLGIALTSFILNFFLVGAVLMGSFNSKFGKITVAKILKFLEKIKVVKNYEKQYFKVMKTMEEYQEALRNYAKKIPVLVFNYLLSLAIIFLNYFMLYLIYISLNTPINSSLFWEIIIKAIMIDIAAGIIPLPGGTGVSEISFSVLFSNIFLNGTIFWGMLLWRVVNFYGMLVQGFVILVYDYFVGNKKYEWQKKKWELENESVDFRNKRLDEYKRKKRRKNSRSYQ